MKSLYWKGTRLPFIAIALCSFAVSAQNPYYMPAPVGYGAGTTGGGKPTASNTVTVTNASDLKLALTGSKSVILISGQITTSRIECTFSDKSIIGLPGAKLINLTQTKDGSGILNLKSGSNFIIRNITFVGPGAYDVDGSDLISNLGYSKLWVDHCEFQDGMDGNFDNTKKADNITVSWCKFTYLKTPKAGGSGGSDDHRFSNLVGGSDSDVPDDGKYSITWINCWWSDGCVDRMVRARNAQNDMLNCYWSSKNASKNIHLSPGTNGTYINVENGVFSCSGQIVNFEKNGNNNIKFTNCTGGGSNTGTVPAITYSWPKTPVGTIVSMVTNASCGAGATLKVSPDGAISSSCEASSTDPVTSIGHNSNTFYIDKNFTVTFCGSGPQRAEITLYSINGQVMGSFTNNSFTDSYVLPNVHHLGPGTYLVKYRSNHINLTSKLIKPF